MIYNSTKKHIVMVDDEPVNLQLAENALKDTYKLTKLISGAQLMTFLTRVKPDLILLDVLMPDMNGYEIIEKIMSNPQISDIPVIFLTGKDGVESERTGFNLGARDFIKKPFDNDIMLARINTQMCISQYNKAFEQMKNQSADDGIIINSLLKLIDARDGTVGTNIQNTCMYFDILINAMAKLPQYEKELPQNIIPLLLKAAAFKDIGKIKISDEILKRTEPFNCEELEIIKNHTVIGAEILDTFLSQSKSQDFLKLARDMALAHHENWDGTGYPYGIKGEDIPLWVRALSIVNTYDKLTAYGHQKAMSILESKKCLFDPDIYYVFKQNEEAIKNCTPLPFLSEK